MGSSGFHMALRFALLVGALFGGANAHGDKDALLRFLDDAMVGNFAETRASDHLPFEVLKSLFHISSSSFDITPFDGSVEEDDTKNLRSFSHILCGPQLQAKLARSEISKHYSGRISILHVSRKADTACWRASLTSADAEKLRSSPAFFHISQIPNIAKFAPDLLFLGSDRKLMPVSQVLSKGIRVQIESDIDPEAKVLLLNRWSEEAVGMKTKTHINFLPVLLSDDSPWRNVKEAINEGHCSSLVQVMLPEHTQRSDILHVSFTFTKMMEEEIILSEHTTVNECVLSSLVYLATQHAVSRIEVSPTFKLHTIKTKDRTGNSPQSETGLLKFPFEEAIRLSVSPTEEVEESPSPKPLNAISTTALQSGNFSQPNPFWDLGINGTGQYVQVTDTGFDDASCFLRQADSASFLTGSLNTNYQVSRSSYSSPVTDFTRRKVVQYIMRDTADAYYGYDYASGHGSHCAGTVAGFIPNDGSTLEPLDDYYTDCADYTAQCSTWFSPGGSYEGTCDTTCNIYPTDSYSGMAPGAKLFVYDFGDNNGALDVPTDMQAEVYQSAHDKGARITSNSWGSGAPYDIYDTQAMNVDQFIYDEDDVLVVFAAGNNNADSADDDIYESGDGSLGSPAISKNVLTVGAAETAYTPDTLASFSSRGPTPDWRLKPDVSGPGDPVYSTKASGSAGLASCYATAKSGTSMATPAVAGTAALIRQILVEGHHAQFSSIGYLESDYNVTFPSGALLKALLIASTVPMTYGYDSAGNGVTLSDFYGASSAVADSTAYALGTDGVDFSQGFGHVRVSNIFALNEEFNTFLFESSLSEYSTWTVSFDIVDTISDVSIVLVWNDPPGALYCGYDYYDGSSTDTCLVHDLDLKVYIDGKRYYSNFGGGDGDYSGQEDTFNNVEKTTLTASSLTVGNTIVVTVETNGLSYADTQKFAVVVKGNLETVNDDDSGKEDDETNDISAGAIAGIVIAVLFVLLVAGGFGFWYSRQEKSLNLFPCFFSSSGTSGSPNPPNTVELSQENPMSQSKGFSEA